jgi:hypothetical protein
MLEFMHAESDSVYLESIGTGKETRMKLFFSVLLIAAGVLNLRRAFRGFWRKPEFTALAADTISQELTKPRISRYMVSVSLMMMVVGVFGLIVAAAESHDGR